MAHRAERKRRALWRAAREEQNAAERYSSEINYQWDKALRKAFGLSHTEYLQPVNAESFYFDLLRKLGHSHFAGCDCRYGRGCRY